MGHHSIDSTLVDKVRKKKKPVVLLDKDNENKKRL